MCFVCAVYTFEHTHTQKKNFISPLWNIFLSAVLVHTVKEPADFYPEVEK